MSRLRLLVALMRIFAKPRLARTETPTQARRDFTRAAKLFRAPPFLLHLPGRGPLPFDDARAAHGTLLDQGYAPGQIVLGGDSAGGGLALALLADICVRNLQPAGLFAFSP